MIDIRSTYNLVHKALTETITGIKTFTQTLFVRDIQFELTPTSTMQEGKLMWDSTAGTLQIGMPGGNVNLQLGQEQHIRAKATENISNGQAVRITGASGNRAEVSLVNNTELLSVDTIAIATENVTSGQNGYFTTFGLVNDIDTNHLTEGASVYLDSTDGALTSTPPTHPNIYTKIGTCIVKSSTVGKLFVEIDSKEWKNVFSVMQDPTGFENRTSSAFTFTDSTLKLSVTVVSGSYDIWFDGVRHNITTTKEITIADTEGIHAIYFDTDDALHEIVNPTIAQVLSFIRDKVAVCILYWDATNKASVLVNEERHGTVMDGITHYYLHYTRGLQYISGLALGDFVIGDGSLNTHAQFSVAEGLISDEDIGLTATAVGSTTGLPILYKSGANGYWRRTTQAGYSVKASGSATNRLYYNQNNAGTWQLTEVGEANYVLCHVYTYSGKTEQLFAIMGQNEYATLNLARSGAQTEISNISLGNLPSPEIRPVGTVIFQTDKDYANDINARIVEAVSGGDDYVNWLTTELPRGVTPADHQSLSNLQLAETTGVTYGHISDTEWTSYAPTLTNITIGNGTKTGYYKKIGKTVFYRVTITFGSTSSMGSTPSISTPTTINGDCQYMFIGKANMLVAGAAYYHGTHWGYGELTTDVIGTTNVYSGGISATVPNTWAANDVIRIQGFYEAG